MVFGIPFVRLQLRCKKVPQRIASASTLAAADMARREQWSPSRLGDYQIAHLPPAAASVGAAKSDPRPRARNISFENKSAGRCGRRVRAQRPPVRKKERPPRPHFHKYKLWHKGGRCETPRRRSSKLLRRGAFLFESPQNRIESPDLSRPVSTKRHEPL